MCEKMNTRLYEDLENNRFYPAKITYKCDIHAKSDNLTGFLMVSLDANIISIDLRIELKMRT